MNRRTKRSRTCAEALEPRLVFTTPTLPTIPAAVFNVTSYGAVADGTTNNASAIQAAITAAKNAGGGTVEFPAASSAYLSGPISLASNINFQVDSGATLMALPYGTYPGSGSGSVSHFINGSNLSNFEISGSGTIDGQGSAWWSAYNANNAIARPRLINLSGSNNILLVQNIHLQNSPQFNLAISGTNNVTIDSISIYNPTSFSGNISPNTDGMDIGGSHWLIQNCTVDTGDDNIVCKPGSTACSDMTITGCTFKAGHGLSIGGQTGLGLNGLTVTNCTFDGTTAGIRMKCDSRQNNGGLVQNCSYSNLTMYNVQYPININSYYNDGSVPSSSETSATYQSITSNTPIWKNITISNVTATWDSTRASYNSSAASNSYCGLIWGLPEMPVQNVSLNNVNITSKKYAFVMDHVRNVHFDRQCKFTPNPSTNQQFISSSASTTTQPYDAAYWTDADINTPSVAGNSTYDVPTGNYTMTGGGADFGTSTTDQFNFNSTTLNGDGTLIAKVNSQTSTNATAKAGVMIRNTSATNSVFAAVAVTPTSGVEFIWRSSAGATPSSTVVTGQTAPLYVKLVRSGSTFSAFYSSNGTAYTQIGTSQTLSMSTSVLAGLAVTSHDNTTSNTAVFSNVELLSIVVGAFATPTTVTGTTSLLTIYAADMLNDPGVTYTWTPTTVPSGAPTPTFGINGTNPAYGSTVTFGKAGTYAFSVSVHSASGLTMTSTISSVVVNQTLTSVAVSPSSASLNWNGTQQFAASAKDQFGSAMSSQPSFTWAIATGGVGSVNSNGLYTAPAANGSATVTATTSSISGSSTVTVTNATPTVATPASASPNPVNGTTTALSVLGADDGGASNLTYSWATTGTPPATVNYSANGTNAAKNTTATFTKTGTYNFQVTIMDGGGLSTTSSVSVTVSQVLTALNVTPFSAGNIVEGNKQQFTVIGVDQFGNNMNASVTWAATNGTITTGGLFIAGQTPGSFGVTATSGSVQGSASGTVVLPSWLSSNSAATWSPATSTLNVTGAATIIADPGTDEPIIQGSSSAAVVTISPSSGLQVHIGGINLTGGASATLTSLGAAHTPTNHLVLVVGSTTNTVAPQVTVDSTSTLDLADNDMAVLYGSGTSPLGTIRSELAQSYDGGAWDQPGLTSSIAAGTQRMYSLGYGEASTLGLSSFDGVTLGGHAVLIRYTLTGDSNLSGNVDLSDYTTVIHNLGNPGNWTEGDFGLDGNVDLGDYTTVIRNLGLGGGNT